MRTTSFRLIPVLIFSLLSPLALAMGNNSTESKTPDCPSGQVYDSATQKCVPDKSSSLSDQDKTNYAYHLAKKGEYQAALNLLDSLKNGNTAEAWNYRGFATRKLGRTDEGIGYYQRALAIAPVERPGQRASRQREENGNGQAVAAVQRHADGNGGQPDG